VEGKGIITPISNWVLREACLQLKNWHDQFPTDLPWTVSVNLSSEALAQNTLVNTISDILSQTKLEAQFLQIEITESALIQTNESALNILTELSNLGIRV
jgi:EAL domain-containing protein (putative c-di-GMP-specific phosphodiesterase class I)